jgi:hypothetical protein
MQRALPLNSSQPALASSEIALASPRSQRSNGASRKISVRSKLARARPTSSKLGARTYASWNIFW